MGGKTPDEQRILSRSGQRCPDLLHRISFAAGVFAAAVRSARTTVAHARADAGAAGGAVGHARADVGAAGGAVGLELADAGAAGGAVGLELLADAADAAAGGRAAGLSAFNSTIVR